MSTPSEFEIVEEGACGVHFGNTSGHNERQELGAVGIDWFDVGFVDDDQVPAKL